MKTKALVVFSIGMLTLAGCSKARRDSAEAATKPSANAPAGYARTESVPGDAPAEAEPVQVQSNQLTLAAGTSFRVRLQETIDTHRNRAGDRFTAVLDEPIVDGDRVVIPKGTDFRGHIIEAKPSGRFKGRAVLALTLDTFSLNGTNYEIRSTSTSRVSQGHKKHHFAWIGGGSGGGAVIGAVAGGGAGALIGAGAGAAAGTVGSAITGKRQVRLPAETTLRFRLQSAITFQG